MNAGQRTNPAILIPVYNHAATLADVVRRSLVHDLPVIVVDDGSTDGSTAALEERIGNSRLHVLCLPYNRGKGAALRAGAEYAAAHGLSHVITVDADGQHYPEDIPLFLATIAAEPRAIVVGARNFSVDNVPRSSRFGRAFSGFWMRVQTGLCVSDMQSGFRAYPLEVFSSVQTGENAYAFEVEVLVRAAWAGFAITEVPVRVHYPPEGERISHFRAIADNVQISLLNTRLTLRALVPMPFVRAADADRISLRRPLASLRLLLREATPRSLGRSAGVSMFLSTLPLPGLQTLLLLLAIGKYRLNRCCALAVIPLSWPPVVPGLGVLVGYRVRQGQWLTEFSLQTLGYEAPQRLLDWVVGAFFLAPVLGVALGCAVWLASSLLFRGMADEREESRGN